MSKKLQIRNSTAEFLVFSKQAGENTIEVRIENETVWLTQKLLAVLFDVEVNTINYHIKEIYKIGEQCEVATIRKIRIVQTEGKRQVEREVDFFNLDMIISVGYRVNSERAMQFRQWATNVLRDFAIRGYVLDKERLKNGAFFSKEYFDNLLAEIREILSNPGHVTTEIAKAFAESEFEKYRVVQDQLYESDFDKLMKQLK
jgi:hypothetical protein